MHPKIRINFIHIPQNYFQKLHLLFASNKAPDVIFINNLYLPVYVGQLEDLTSLIDTGDFYPQSVQALSQNNKLYAVPRDISNLIIYYNEDITGKLEPNWNFEDFKNLIKKTAVNKTFGISYERDIYWASPYIMTLGYNKGIELFGSIDMYNSMLSDWYKGINDKWNKIISYKNNSDMTNYAIEVHSLKNDSKYFEFTKLAELSYNHELKSKDNDIELVLTANPFICPMERQRDINFVEQLATQNNIDFINFIKMNNVVDYNIDLYDYEHVNQSGLNKMCNYWGSYLVTNYELQDHRGDAKYYKLWEKEYEEFKQLKYESMWWLTDNIEEFLQMLHDKDFDVSIFVGAESQA